MKRNKILGKTNDNDSEEDDNDETQEIEGNEKYDEANKDH